MNLLRRSRVALPALALMGPLWLSAEESWRAVVEQDWARQDAKRFAPAQTLTPAEDAAGAVDGIKTGKWGFHTAFENNPWWEVDLGAELTLDHCLIYNRCDAFPERNARIVLSSSTDGQRFTVVYSNPGTVFYGQTDGQPLRVELKGLRTRYVRLSLEGQQYLHLDEVELYTQPGGENVALARAARQSSLSEWSVRHAKPGPAPEQFRVAAMVESGLKLAAALERLGMNTQTDQARLRETLRAWQQLSPDAGDAARRALYLQARWTVRTLALANPLLSFDSILFTQRAPGMFPHMSDQYYGWWSRPGGGLYRLRDFKNPAHKPTAELLTPDLPPGNVMGPDVSWDARRALFAYAKHYPHLANEPNKADKSRVPEDAFYHLFELDLATGARRALTRGKYDDFEPRYLPSGEVVFLSTRKGIAIQCSDWFADRTRTADQPDSYVRCGGDNYRPVPVFTLHAMEPDSGRIRSLSAFENFEWTPALAHDGRILYTRWDYIDRFNGHFFSLWSANQDGTNPQLVYGNYTVKPQVVFEARPIPGSAKLVFTASAHHSNLGGSICLLDRERGTEGEAPITRITPEVRFPETEGNDDHYYANPWPLSEEFFLVAWSDAPLPGHGRFEGRDQNPVHSMGLYLLDAFGNLELLYRDPAISSMYPVPIQPRTPPPQHSTLAEAERQTTVLLQDIYAGLNGVPRGSVQAVRVIGVVPKVQPHMNQPVLGVSAEDPGKFVLGTAPVAEDGSAYFKIPSGIPVFFQALDRSGVAVQTMRTLTYASPGQTLSCIGCHEHRDSAPSQAPLLAAATGAPARLKPAPSGSWPLRFDQLVQPVLDRHCVACHQPNGPEPDATRLPLTAEHAYATLIGFADGNLKKLAFERDRSYPNEGVAAHSRLWQMLTGASPHHEVDLDPDSRDRLATWLDTYAHRLGHFSPEQERELIALRESLGPILEGGAGGPAAR